MIQSNSTIKFSSPLTIQYIFITDDHNYKDNEYHVNSLNLLRTLPIELIQLHNSINHFEFCFRYKTVKGYEIFTFPSIFFNLEREVIFENLNDYSNQFGIQSLIKVFVIDSKVTNHDKIAEFLKCNDLYYYIIIGIDNDNNHIFKKYCPKNIFTDTSNFINLIKKDINIIKNRLSQHYKKQGESIDVDIDTLINPQKTFLYDNNEPGAILAWNNYFVLNQIIGNFWLDENSKFGEATTSPEERTIELIEQCQKLDSISAIMYNDVGIKPTDPFQPLLNTLVLISPYHYPKLSKILPSELSKQGKKWLSLLNTEQDLNYRHSISKQAGEQISEEVLGFIMHRNFLRLNFLDSVAYLHAMFTYSPVIRMPQIGKSINLELSHLEKITQNKQSTISNITKFGKKLSSLVLKENTKEYIKNRNGQIFAISDLPLEWLYLDDYPLCFTHDVCRLPEFNLNSIVNNAIHLQRRLFEIPENLITKTLIVHCASKNDVMMNQMFDVIDNYQEKLGFNSVRCSTIEDIKLSIEKHKPDLLIFDCHGKSDRKNLSSFLVVDGENNIFLTGEDIIKFNISAPLVFLSACETFPNYGYVKLLSDAFMQSGAFCVTTTFLPIKISDATSLIIRLLNNLKQLETNSYHMNWLNFLSHILRSTLIYETINKSRSHFKEEITNNQIAEIVTKSMKFENRLEALNELNKLIKEKSTKHISFNQLDNEWLSYSIIGRADLIYFRNWQKKYRDLNLQ